MLTFVTVDTYLFRWAVSTHDRSLSKGVFLILACTFFNNIPTNANNKDCERQNYSTAFISIWYTFCFVLIK